MATNNITNEPIEVASETAPPVVCIYCGASPGNEPIYIQAAEAIATILAQRGYHLVYGAGTAGMMGMVGSTFVKHAGPEAVTGVIPTPLIEYEAKTRVDNGEKSPAELAEINYQTFGKRIEVGDMHERKLEMARLVCEGGPGSGFIALPGGFGTLDEIFEMSTWNQLGILKRGCVFFNVDGYYDDIIKFVKKANKKGFITANNIGILRNASTAEGVIEALHHWEPSPDSLHLAWNVVKRGWNAVRGGRSGPKEQPSTKA